MKRKSVLENRKYEKGMRLSSAELVLLRMALRDYKNPGLEKEKQKLIKRLREVEKRYGYVYS